MGLRRWALAAAAFFSLSIGAVTSPVAQSMGPGQPRIAAKAAFDEAFRLAPSAALHLELEAPDPAAIEALKQKNSASRTKRLEIGIGRDLAEASERAGQPAWRPAGKGMAAHWKVTSRQAKALRVAVDVRSLAAGAEIRFSGSASPVVYGPITLVDLMRTGFRHWSPVLEGETATIEVFVPSPSGIGDTKVDIAMVSHLFVSPSHPDAELLAKASGPCEVDIICRSANDAQLANTSKSVARMTFGTSGTALCTGTLLNPSDGSFAPYFYSAAHCISTQSEASTLNTHWFYERTSCGGGAINPSYTQVGGGATMLYANSSNDVFFARLNSTPPQGAVWAGWDAATLSGGALTAIHHPDGDPKKVSLGSFGGLGPATGLTPTGSFIRVNWDSINTGVTEGGSSGSGIFSGSSSAGYLFRGGLLGGPSSCTAAASNLYDYYSRFDLVYPTLAQWLNPGPTLPEGANILANPGFESGSAGWSQSSSDGVAIITNDATFAHAGTWYAWLGGDVNVTDTLSQDFVVPATQARLQFWYRIATNETLSGEYDRLNVSLVNPANGSVLTTLATFSNRATTSGWVQSQAYDISAYAGQTVRLRFDSTNDFSDFTSFRIDDVSVRGAQTSGGNNYTALWWNQNESGWGINVTQQGDIVFATLFTYDSFGAPMWLVASEARRQGSSDIFSGALYRTTGPVFNASPWSGVTVTQVGTISFVFNGPNSGALTYSYNGVSVTKSIEKQVYGSRAANCVTTTGSRSGATNYQDLWWNPAESGWGINLTHQDNLIFATLFTYGPNGQVMWYVMSGGARQSDGSFVGDLYRTTGPAFNASPWSGVTVTRVGTMRLRFTNGENGTLEYSVDGVNVAKVITRQVFSTPVPLCS